MPHRNLRDQEIPTLTPRRSPRFTPVAAIELFPNKKQTGKTSKGSRKSSTRLKWNSENLQNKGTVNVEASPPKKVGAGSVSNRKSKTYHVFEKMPHRNLRDEEKATTLTLRRSPRFTAAGGIKLSAREKPIEEVSKGSRKSSATLQGCSRLKSGNVQNNGTGNIERRVTRSNNSVEQIKGDVKITRKHGQEETSSGRISRATRSIERPVVSPEVAGCGEDDNVNGKKEACLKRKRTRAVEESSSSIANGWSNEQELALQSAYFAAKATPNFWKKVAKMVPGKSAKECFDKIHSDFLTPPHPQPRSRVKKMITSSLSPCATKLLQSTEKNTNKRKAKSHLSQKKYVRQLLQKQNDIDHRDKEADFFNVLEPSTSDPDAREFFTPESKKGGLSLLKICLERSSSAHTKHLSPLSGSSGAATLTSPPVLKPIKNKALHERYIDQLHCREAKRKAATSRTAKGNQKKNDGRDESVRKMDAIKAAKNALISEARDAIHQFQTLQECAMNSVYDDDGDDDDNHNCDDDVEDA